MKKCKRLVSVLLCILLITAVMAAASAPAASAAEYNPSYGVVFTDSTTGFSYASLTASPEECIIIEYDGKEKDVVIPSTMPYSPQPLVVTGLKSMLFQNMDITSVSLPDTLTDIGQNAFSGCTQLQEVTIPDSVEFLGFGAFLNCTGLKKIHFGGGLTSTGSQVMMNCSALEEATFAQGSTYIGTRFFRGCTALKKLVLADSITSVGTEAFKECVNLEEVVIGDGIQNLDAFTFNLATSEEPDKVNTALKKISIGGGVRKVPAKMFANCTSLKDVTLSEGLEEIDDRAFENCALEGTVVIPDSVTTTRNYIFKDCNGIEELVLGKGLTDISYSFFQMRGLKRVIVPETLASIGYVAFGECNALEKVLIPRQTEEIDANAFGGFTHLTVYGYTGSAAQAYADSRADVTFVALDDANKTALKTALDQAEQVKAEGLDQYTEQSVQKFEAAYDAAAAIYADVFSIKQQIDQAEQNLTAAIKGLDLQVNKTALKAALDRADATIAEGLDGYTQKSVQDFEEAYDRAAFIYTQPNATQKQVDDAATELDGAREALEPFTGDVDKTGLLDAITKADAVREQGLTTGYVQSTVEAFEAAYSEAAAVYQDKDAQQAEVNAKKDALYAATQALRKMGDIDADGEITLQDVLAVQKYIARVEQLDDLQLAAADTDHNGKAELNDVLLIQKFLSKMIPAL